MAGMRLNDSGFAIRAVRWLLGVQLLLSGLNWWVKMLPFPSMHDTLTGPMKHPILGTMIESGWMFTSAKAIEILLGLALIFNRHAVLMLVIGFPIMLMTFLLDLLPFLGGKGSLLDMLFFGGGVFAMQAYLMSEWFGDYRALFAVTPGGTPARWSALFEAGWLKLALRWLSYTVGAASTIWMIGLATRLIPWSSLAILAPAR